MKPRIFILILSLLFALKSFGQLNTNVYLSPRLTVGYTFYSGFNYGVDLTIGLFRIKSDPEINVCISPQYYFVNYKHNVHNLISFNVVAESDFFRIGGGIGQSITKWGFKRINRNAALGYQIDAAISTTSKYTPWLQMKAFMLHNGYWEFYGRPYYLSADMFFRPEPYVIYYKK